MVMLLVSLVGRVPRFAETALRAAMASLPAAARCGRLTAPAVAAASRTASALAADAAAV